MGLNYSIAMLKNPQNQDESAKAYAKSQITRELPLKELSRRVAAQTTASRADVTAVIIATVENMIDGLRAGEQVDFGAWENSVFRSPAEVRKPRKNSRLPTSPELISSSFQAKI